MRNYKGGVEQQFTYESYKMLLKNLLEKGYQFRNYKNWMETEKTVILRHDVDMDLYKAVRLAEIEESVSEQLNPTYFVLVSTNFYNVHSKDARECMSKIMKHGGNIGLHFDETQYSITDENEMKDLIYKEIESLSNAIDTKVDVVSMHRPSEKILSANLTFPDLVNSYNDVYFKEMKYLSDSRRYWKEDIDSIIEEDIYTRLHILTHPFWYTQGREKSLKQTLKEAMLNASLDYYDNINENFRDLAQEIKREEIEGIIYRQNMH